MSIHSIHFIPPKKAGSREYIELVILIVLLLLAIGFIWWIQNGYTTNFIDTFK
jgi:uncharacterized membrane protein YhfC